MQSSPEKKIRLKAILIYIILIIICGIVIFYVFSIKTLIEAQTKDIKEYYKELSLTNDLIYNVDVTQKEMSDYIITHDDKHLEQFNLNLLKVEGAIDNLTLLLSDTTQIKILLELKILFKEKEKYIKELNQHFAKENPISSIDKVIGSYDFKIPSSSILHLTTVQNTTIHKSDANKTLWAKLIDSFSAKKDTIPEVETSISTDTIVLPRNDSILDISIINDIVKKASRNYLKNIQIIERNVNLLLLSDQMISSKIFTLFIQFYDQAIVSRFEDIKRTEELINENKTYALIGSFVVLIFILIFVLLIFKDLDKAFKLRRELEKANLQIKEIMESRHKLLLSVSHDIKTPLYSILGYIELKQDTERLNKEEITSIQNSGEHIFMLLSNFTTFSNIDQGNITLNKSTFNLNNLYSDIVKMFLPLATQKKLKLKHNSFNDKQVVLYSDPTKIKQIIINLISNSIKYTISGQIDLNITFYDGNLHIIVEDTGIGFPKNKIKELYKPFYRIEKAQSIAEGSGLGLFVVKRLLELLSGEIEISSSPNKGTKIQVCIPAELVNERPLEKPLNILMIDDDIAFLKLCDNYISSIGHKLETISKLDELIDRLNRVSEYDYIMTDMKMDKFSGIDVFHKIREFSETIPVIIITSSEDLTYEELKKIGFSAYLNKPISVNIFRDLLGEYKNVSSMVSNLENIIGKDDEALQEVLEIFLSSTKENLILLEKYWEAKDFENIRFICHKMLPMFLQIGETSLAAILKELETCVGFNTKTDNEWEALMIELKTKIKDILDLISIEIENYKSKL